MSHPGRKARARKKAANVRCAEEGPMERAPLGFGPVLRQQRLGADFTKPQGCKRGERADWAWDWRKHLSVKASNRVAAAE